MKIYKDIVQGTEDWMRLKYGRIGGTLAKGLFTDTDTLLTNLTACYLEPFELEIDTYISTDMQRGIELEPLAMDRLIEYTGVNFENVGWIESMSNLLLGISPDGLSQCETIAAEIKCPSKERHTKTLLGKQIPLDNLHQCVHYFTVNPKLEKLYFCSFRPESRHPLFVKELTRNAQVNLGTKAKPVIKHVFEWANLARASATRLEEQINETIKSLEF